MTLQITRGYLSARRVLKQWLQISKACYIWCCLSFWRRSAIVQKKCCISWFVWVLHVEKTHINCSILTLILTLIRMRRKVCMILTVSISFWIPKSKEKLSCCTSVVLLTSNCFAKLWPSISALTRKLDPKANRDWSATKLSAKSLHSTHSIIFQHVCDDQNLCTGTFFHLSNICLLQDDYIYIYLDVYVYVYTHKIDIVQPMMET